MRHINKGDNRLFLYVRVFFTFNKTTGIPGWHSKDQGIVLPQHEGIISVYYMTEVCGFILPSFPFLCHVTPP